MLNAVEINKVDENCTDLASAYYQLCSFCGKGIKVKSKPKSTAKRSTGNESYCSFCLRHNHHHRSSNNILVMSYRGIFGYYYYKFYDAEPRIMWLSEIQSMIESHSHIGLNNPALNYDHYNYLWFINFNKIGEARHQIPFDAVLQTSKAILDVLQISKKFNSVHVYNSIWDKFSKAIILFHQQRKRPKDRRMLIPTFSDIISESDQSVFDYSRDFSKFNMSFV